MKANKSLAKTLLRILLFGGLGVLSGILVILIMKGLENTQIQGLFSTSLKWLAGQAITLEIFFTLIWMGLGIYYYIRAKKQIPKYHDLLSKLDEEESSSDIGLIDDQFDKALYKSMNLSGSIFAINFSLLALSIEGTKENLMWFIPIFLISTLSGSWLEMTSVALIQKKDPRYVGDPSSASFQRDWLNSMDEAERILMYQAAFKAYMVTKYTLLGAMVFTTLMHLIIGAQLLAVFILALLWIVHMLAYTISVQRLSSQKLKL